MPNTAAPAPDLARRTGLTLLLGGGLAALLAGCASRPPVARPGGSVAARGTPVPPTQLPLELDPAGREASVAQAMLLVNTPYRYGGNTPEGGFDCSGLVRYVFDHVAAGTPAARRLPRTTAQWAAATVPVAEGLPMALPALAAATVGTTTL